MYICNWGQNFTPVLFFFLNLFLFLGPHPQHMEVLRLGVELELQMLAYTTAIATQDLSHVCDLHHSSWQRQIHNPLGEARNWICILMDTSPRFVTTEPWKELLECVLNPSSPRTVTAKIVLDVLMENKGSFPLHFPVASGKEKYYLTWPLSSK